RNYPSAPASRIPVAVSVRRSLGDGGVLHRRFRVLRGRRPACRGRERHADGALQAEEKVAAVAGWDRSRGSLRRVPRISTAGRSSIAIRAWSRAMSAPTLLWIGSPDGAW